MINHHRHLLALAAATVLLAGCSRHTPAPNRQSGPATTSATGVDTRVIPTESPSSTVLSTATSSPTVSADPAIVLPSIPAATMATKTPVAAARAWAIAANSSSYLDPSAGTWTERAKPFVAGAEATAEQRQHGGGGGSTWAQIHSAKCVTSLRELTAGIPSRDVPTGPALHIVYVAATIALTCATGQVQLSQFSAQLTVTRVQGHWLVTDVLH